MVAFTRTMVMNGMQGSKGHRWVPDNECLAAVGQMPARHAGDLGRARAFARNHELSIFERAAV
jgi:hypothetical protein